MKTDTDHGPMILEFVTTYQQAHGHAPTYRAIAEAIGVYSLDHVRRDLLQLVNAGKVTLIYERKACDGRPVHRPVAYSARYKCTRCHIQIGAVTGLCEDCAESKPLITYADAMGADRFYQMSRPAPTGMGYEKETRPRVRRAYNRKASQ